MNKTYYGMMVLLVSKKEASGGVALGGGYPLDSLDSHE